MRKIAAVLLAGGLLAGVVGSASAKPVAVIEDPSGDADAGQGAGASIPGGFDIVEGSIEKKGADLVFTMTHADMPPSGSLPEGARFLWAFNIGDKGYRWTFKTADIGKPDVLGNQTTERIGRVDPMGHFRLEGDCATEATPVGVSAINCKPLGYYEGTIDAGTKSLSVTIPLKDLKVKPGTKITPGAGDNTGICQVCWVSHTAERSLDATIIDNAVMSGTYKVPRK